MKTNIVLIGLPGCGKTSVGRAAGLLGGLSFIDMDAEIVNRYGMSIPHIFNQYGESYFRTLETAAAKDLSRGSNIIIATGGGAVTVPDTMKYLKTTGIVIYLQCDLETLFTRTRGDTNRPLLNTANPDGDGGEQRLERLRVLLSEREVLYRRYSDYVLNADSESPETLAESILSIRDGRYD